MNTQKNEAIHLILVVLGMLLLVMLLNVSGMQGLLKYIPYYLIVHLVFLGLRIWLKQKWLGYVPGLMIGALSLTIISITLISSNQAMNLGEGIAVLIALLGIAGAFYSLYISHVLELIFIDEHRINSRLRINIDGDLILCVFALGLWLYFFIAQYNFFGYFNFFGYLVISLVGASIYTFINYGIYYLLKKRVRQLLITLIILTIGVMILPFLNASKFFFSLLLMTIVFQMIAYIAVVYYRRYRTQKKLQNHDVEQITTTEEHND